MACGGRGLINRQDSTRQRKHSTAQQTEREKERESNNKEKRQREAHRQQRKRHTATTTQRVTSREKTRKKPREEEETKRKKYSKKERQKEKPRARVIVIEQYKQLNKCSRGNANLKAQKGSNERSRETNTQAHRGKQSRRSLGNIHKNSTTNNSNFVYFTMLTFGFPGVIIVSESERER